MIEINPLPERPASRRSSVTISEVEAIARGALTVRLPRRGRLGDTVLLDATGRPDNIMATPDAAARWPSIGDALADFARVAAAFDRLNGYDR